MERPDIIVGIDLGTTYTGVAWARPQRNSVLQSPIQIIHNWPGTSTKNEQKVHTCLVYNNNDNSLSSWGPLCEDEDDLTGKTRREFFKIFLDRDTLQTAHQSGIAQAPASVADAQRLVTDYLRQVYAHVKATVELHTGIGHIGWQDLAVEFAFSVPTTWTTQEIINVFKSTIRDAGFGTEGKRHIATVELTESEAAAVGTVKSSSINFAAGDIFLCVDAGGGTTDFALMRVLEAREPFPSLSQISQVDGIGIGAALIDQAFVTLVNTRLARFPDLVSQLPPDCTQRLVKSERYKTMKHKFGEKVYQSPSYKLTLEGAPYTLNHPAAGIEQGRIVLSWEEVSNLFEPHIISITRKIDEQLNWMQANGIERPIRYMILSGGLGSSRYVRDRIQQLLANARHPYAQQVQILQAPDPQLVVVKGLLLDRLQSLDSDTAPVIVSRVARASYGYLCKKKYNPAIHGNEEVLKDPYDGELYAMDQIDWLIKKGDPVQTNKAISSSFTKKVERGDSNRTWDSVIVVCDLEKNVLPSSMQGYGARKLCTVTSNLAGVQDHEMVMKRKARRFFFKGKKFYLCTFEVRAIVAPADIRFELWFAGNRFSKNHESIKIAWNANGIKG